METTPNTNNLSIVKIILIELVYFLAATQTVFMVAAIAFLICLLGVGLVGFFGNQVVTFNNWLSSVFNISHTEFKATLEVKDFLWIYSLLSIIIYLIKLLLKKFFHYTPKPKKFITSFFKTGLPVAAGYVVVFIIFKIQNSDWMSGLIFFFLFSLGTILYSLGINKLAEKIVKVIESLKF